MHNPSSQKSKYMSCYQRKIDTGYEDNLKNEDDQKHECKLTNVDNCKNEDNLKN